jgi:WYL_2, Sm-like SH3 beta-barrel fold
MTTLEIINSINELDYNYGNIDNGTEYHYFAKIDRALTTVTHEQAVEIYNAIKENRKSTYHGKALFAMMPTPEPTPTITTTKSAKKVSLFNNAWSMFRDGLFVTFGEALKAAWSRLKVVTGMKTGVVTFEYIKSDGTVRFAKGTLTGFDYTPKTTESKPKPEIIKYFDIEAQSFRSFRLDRFIGLVA